MAAFVLQGIMVEVQIKRSIAGSSLAQTPDMLLLLESAHDCCMQVNWPKPAQLVSNTRLCLKMHVSIAAV